MDRQVVDTDLGIELADGIDPVATLLARAVEALA